MLLNWYRRVTELEHFGNDVVADAMFNIGLFYDCGLAVSADGGYLAVDWYKRAAALGNKDALNNLGACFELGTDVEKDMGAAIDLYHRAAAAGNACACYNLGRIYSDYPSNIYVRHYYLSYAPDEVVSMRDVPWRKEG